MKNKKFDILYATLTQQIIQNRVVLPYFTKLPDFTKSVNVQKPAFEENQCQFKFQNEKLSLIKRNFSRAKLNFTVTILKI